MMDMLEKVARALFEFDESIRRQQPGAKTDMAMHWSLYVPQALVAIEAVLGFELGTLEPAITSPTFRGLRIVTDETMPPGTFRLVSPTPTGRINPDGSVTEYGGRGGVSNKSLKQPKHPTRNREAGKPE